jgi:hypothetical protein
MSLVSNVVFDGAQQRSMSPGDVLNSAESQQALANAAGQTLTVAQVLTSLLTRSGAVTVSDTTPDSASWISAMLQGAYVGGGASTPLGVQPGTSYRLRILNNNTGTLTLVAGTGVTLAGTTTILTVNFRDYLITVLNGTPQQIFAASTTNASAVVTGMSAAQTQAISPGMLVTGTGIPAAATVLSVQPGVGFTLSANATATGSLVALTFLPRIEVRGIGTGAV